LGQKEVAMSQKYWRRYYFRVLGFALSGAGLALAADEVIQGSLNFARLGHEHVGVALFIGGLVLISLKPRGK